MTAEDQAAAEEMAQPKDTPAPDKPKAEPIRLTLERVSMFIGGLDRKQCWLWDTVEKRYINEPGAGYSYNSNDAHRYTPRKMLDHWGNSQLWKVRLTCELVDQDLALELSTRKLPKCAIEQALRASLIELLKLAPLNPTARACIMRETTKMPPDSCKTYEELKAWIEENCEPRMSQSQIVAAQRAATMQQVAVDLAAGDDEAVAFTTTLRFRDRAYGRADYRQRRESIEEYSIPANVVQDCLNQLLREVAHPSLENLNTRLVNRMGDDAWNIEPDMENTGDPEYEHDGQDGTDRATVEPYNQASFRENLRDYLRATLTPEQAARIEGL